MKSVKSKLMMGYRSSHYPWLPNGERYAERGLWYNCDVVLCKVNRAMIPLRVRLMNAICKG